MASTMRTILILTVAGLLLLALSFVQGPNYEWPFFTRCSAVCSGVIILVVIVDELIVKKWDK
jgi:hypothetical protein